MFMYENTQYTLYAYCDGYMVKDEAGDYIPSSVSKDFCLQVLDSLEPTTTAFSQNNTSSESKVELAGDKIQIVYTFDAPTVADTSQMDEALLEKTREIVFEEGNAWAQTYPVGSVQEAETLLGIDFLIHEPIEEYEPNPNKEDTVCVQATATGKIASTTYTCHRTYNGYSVTFVADTVWDGSASGYKEYAFPFSQNQYTVKDVSFTMPSGKSVTIYEVLDQKGAIAGQYVMFHKDATNYLLYLIPYAKAEQPAEEKQGGAMKALLNDLKIEI